MFLYRCIPSVGSSPYQLELLCINIVKKFLRFNFIFTKSNKHALIYSINTVGKSINPVIYTDVFFPVSTDQLIPLR